MCLNFLNFDFQLFLMSIFPCDLMLIYLLLVVNADLLYDLLNYLLVENLWLYDLLDDNFRFCVRMYEYVLLFPFGSFLYESGIFPL